MFFIFFLCDLLKFVTKIGYINVCDVQSKMIPKVKKYSSNINCNLIVIICELRELKCSIVS